MISYIPNYFTISETPIICYKCNKTIRTTIFKIVSEYDQVIPQSQTADNPVAPQGSAAQPSRDTRKTN